MIFSQQQCHPQDSHNAYDAFEKPHAQNPSSLDSSTRLTCSRPGLQVLITRQTVSFDQKLLELSGETLKTTDCQDGLSEVHLVPDASIEDARSFSSDSFGSMISSESSSDDDEDAKFSPCETAFEFMVSDELEVDSEESDVSEYGEEPPSSVLDSVEYIPSTAFDIHEDNATLYYLKSTKGVVVIDSICPERAPHIAIWPVEQDYENEWTAWGNRVGMQDFYYLAVPPFTMGMPSPHCQLPPDDLVPTPTATNDDPRSPRPVFSPGKFNYFLDSSENQRLVMYHVVPILQRQAIKSIGYTAARYAATFRRRYDSRGCFDHIEKPFKWVDPGEAILEQHKYITGTLILDSHLPFAAPHIVLTPAPHPNPWDSWLNSTPSPQDHGFGDRLTVPASYVVYGNYYTCTGDVVDADGSIASGQIEESVLQDERRPEFTDTDAGEDYSDAGSESSDDIEIETPNHSGFVQCSAVWTGPVEVFYDDDDDDEEDGLPEFDEWYERCATYRAP